MMISLTHNLHIGVYSVHKCYLKVGAVLIVMVLALAMLGQPALSGAISPCQRPKVFNGANVNMLVLPYTYIGQHYIPLSKTGEKLALLIQLDSLFTMLKLSQAELGA